MWLVGHIFVVGPPIGGWGMSLLVAIRPLVCFALLVTEPLFWGSNRIPLDFPPSWGRAGRPIGTPGGGWWMEDSAREQRFQVREWINLSIRFKEIITILNVLCVIYLVRKLRITTLVLLDWIMSGFHIAIFSVCVLPFIWDPATCGSKSQGSGGAAA